MAQVITENVTCRGVEIPLDGDTITPMAERKLRKEFYETPEVMGLPKFIRKKDRVLELGAGIGFISTYLSKVLGVSHVSCVEANPKLCEFIARVHSVNGVSNAQIWNAVALSDVEGIPDEKTLPFYVTTPFWSSSMIQPSGDAYVTQDVPVIRLSDIVAEVSPTVIVCDIEGGEADLFEKVDLSGVRYIYMELHTRTCGGTGIVKVFENMHRHGFFYHQGVSSAGVVLFKKL